MSPCRVVFRDRWRTASLDLPSEPLLVPPELQLTSRSPGLVVLGPPDTTDEMATDVVAGSVPVIYLDGDRPKVAWLDIPPPPPLRLVDLDHMWRQLVEAGLPIPSSVGAQGRLPSGLLEPRQHLLAEYVELGHRLARSALATWPTRRKTQIRWQHLELPGGREDPVVTARGAARYPGLSAGVRTLPARSARRVGAAPAWTSKALAQAAASASRLLLEAEWLGDIAERRTVVRPFLEVAAQATGDPGLADPPRSSWPTLTRQLFECLVALQAVATATVDHGPTSAPLCYVWRLYEAWIASEVLLGLDSLDGAVRTELHAGSPGYEWLARWTIPAGELLVCAQFRVGSTPDDLGRRLPHGLLSNTSILIPDVSVFLSSAGQLRCVVVDAKRRSSVSMRADDAAEAASKYVWGLRIDGPRLNEPRIDVAQVVIATTALAPSMFSARSRITAARVIPGSSGALTKAVVGSLGLSS